MIIGAFRAGRGACRARPASFALERPRSMQASCAPATPTWAERYHWTDGKNRTPGVVRLGQSMTERGRVYYSPPIVPSFHESPSCSGLSGAARRTEPYSASLFLCKGAGLERNMF